MQTFEALSPFVDMPESHVNLTSISAPSGYVVNFEDPSRKGDILGYVTTSVGMALSLGFLAIRMYTKVRIARDFSFEDVALLFSWVRYVLRNSKTFAHNHSSLVSPFRQFCYVNKSLSERWKRRANMSRPLDCRSSRCTHMGNSFPKISVLQQGRQYGFRLKRQSLTR